MDRTRWVWLLLVAVTTVPASRALGADDGVPVAELLTDNERLVAWLADHNPDVGAARERVAQAEADLAQSRALTNPTLSAGLSDVTFGTTNPAGLHFHDTAITTATLSQTVEVGKRRPRIASAEFRLTSARESYLDALAQKANGARQALARLVYLRVRQDFLDQILAGAREGLTLQRTRFDHGDLSGNDFDRLQLETVLLETDASQTRADAEAAHAACSALLAAACRLGAGDAALLAQAVDAPPEPDDSVSRRADLRALAAAEAGALEDARLARRRRVPDPTLSIGYTHDALVISGDQPNTLGFAVSLPLPLFDRGRNDAARSELRARELDQTARGVREQAHADIAGLRSRLASTEAVLASLDGDAMERSRRVLASTAEAVSRGELSTTDLLLARRTHTDLALKVIDLQWAAFGIRNDLRLASGREADLARTLRGESWTKH